MILFIRGQYLHNGHGPYWFGSYRLDTPGRTRLAVPKMGTGRTPKN